MLKLVPDRTPRRIAPGRVHLVTRSARAMEHVPTDREAKLLEILDSLIELELDPITPPEIWKLRVIQSYARRRVAEYTR